MSFSRRPIIVVGMDRSGTSLVAGLVARWGAYGGDPARLAEGNDFNPRGFYENGDLEYLLAEVLNSAGVGYWDPAFPSRLGELAAYAPFAEAAVQLVEWMGNSGRPWFFKEPVLSVTLPFLLPFLDGAVYVIPVRHPYDSAVSYERFLLSAAMREQEISLRAVNLLRWQHFMRSCLAAVEGTEDKIFVSYEELTADPERQCARLAGFLDSRYGTAGLPADRVARMIDAVAPELRRNRTSVPFDDLTDVSAEQKALYRFLLAKVADPGLPYDPELYPMYAGWREIVGSVTRLAQLQRELEPALNSPIVATAYYAHLGLRWLGEQPRRWWGRRQVQRDGR